MEAADFLATAESLADGSRESDWRSSISRAYYSSYNTACELVRKGVDEPRLRRSRWRSYIAHVKLREALSGASDQGVRLAGKMLGDLYEERKIADYKLGKRVDKDKAEEACVNAHLLNRELRTLGKDRIAAPARICIDRFSPPLVSP